jgi:cytochrome c553
MKNVKMAVLTVVVLVFAALTAYAVQQEASAEKGRALFNDPNLGTNGKTCDTCHHDGKGLANAAAKGDLNDTISGCIRVSLKGNPLGTNSVEVRSLALYIKSMFEKKPAMKAPVGC